MGHTNPSKPAKPLLAACLRSKITLIPDSPSSRRLLHPLRLLNSTCLHRLISTQVCKTIDTGHSSTPTRSASHHSCLIGSSSSRRTHQVKNLFRLLEKTNNAFFRPCRIFLLIGAIQASICACKAWSHCEDECYVL
ncbi:unnamed protein product [Trichogramma brassicae]|uniref:Uncharacterized protein n=1 Tax=Trichogramma brassicae TaxID=86971 RepID=A0A6H5HZY4_9HYME|nr:unnamed protein product [Trichogramma brassicae]